MKSSKNEIQKWKKRQHIFLSSHHHYFSSSCCISLSVSVTQSLSQSRLQKKTTMQSYLSSPTPLLSCTSRLQHPLPSFTTTIHTKPFLHVLFFDSILRLSSSNSLSHTESQKRHPLYICLLLRLTH